MSWIHNWCPYTTSPGDHREVPLLTKEFVGSLGAQRPARERPEVEARGTRTKAPSGLGRLGAGQGSSGGGRRTPRRHSRSGGGVGRASAPIPEARHKHPQETAERSRAQCRRQAQFGALGAGGCQRCWGAGDRPRQREAGWVECSGRRGHWDAQLLFWRRLVSADQRGRPLRRNGTPVASSGLSASSETPERDAPTIRMPAGKNTRRRRWWLPPPVWAPPSC